jgi:hypothetical protein
MRARPDLVEQLRQHGAGNVAARRKLNGTDVRSGRIHGQTHLASLAPGLNAIRSSLPIAIAEELDPGHLFVQPDQQRPALAKRRRSSWTYWTCGNGRVRASSFPPV